MTLSNLLTNLRELQISKSGIKTANKLTPISEIASFAEFESELLDFSENYISFDDSGIALKSILQKVYTAGTISGFDKVQIKNGAITGTFYENLTPTLSKRFSFTASPAGIYYELINADQLESANYSESEISELDFAAIKTKACKTGKPCHRPDGTIYCISKGFKCPNERETKADKVKRTFKPSPAEATALAKIIDNQIAKPDAKVIKARISSTKLAELSKKVDTHLNENESASVADLQKKLGYPASKYGNEPETNPVNKILAELRDHNKLTVGDDGKVSIDKNKAVEDSGEIAKSKGTDSMNTTTTATKPNDDVRSQSATQKSESKNSEVSEGSIIDVAGKQYKVTKLRENTISAAPIDKEGRIKQSGGLGFRSADAFNQATGYKVGLVAPDSLYNKKYKFEGQTVDAKTFIDTLASKGYKVTEEKKEGIKPVTLVSDGKDTYKLDTKDEREYFKKSLSASESRLPSVIARIQQQNKESQEAKENRKQFLKEETKPTEEARSQSVAQKLDTSESTKKHTREELNSMGGRSSEYLKLVTPIKDRVLPLVEAHSAYKDLKATIDRSIASTYDGKTGVETQEYLKKYMQSPENYLTNLPLNVKSGSGKKIEELQGQIRRELNLPKEGVGTYRSNNIDWNKMIIDEQAKPSTPKSESTSSKSPTQMTKDEYIASIPKVVAMSLSTSKLKNGRYARLKDKISGLEDKGSASIGSKNSMVLMPDTQENRDYIKGIGGSVSRDQGLANGANQFPESSHRNLVATALKNGEDLPKAVLADYPDLVARQKAAIDKFN